ncbi:DUF1611 domain-containing protein [Stakelama tenebrarum]|uniref:DUF1611 domain-containing protein n=1 Tax=Stakelama tenebrarum TaxID=2711215 RepID=A0A6G6YAC3_9SPHN|nr:DUF1611 domain-containing protein [Sphingosinithalassobacter tenebrarum]QIG81526.1 DUF1611 domain-containing protein [Sphingosinithalassobacter tenebrarum]
MNAPFQSRTAEPLALPQPYLLFLGDTQNPQFAKTAFGLRDWAGELCIGEYGVAGCGVSTGLPAMTPRQAREAGARALVIGVANQGGIINADWVPALVAALEAGLDLVSGLHARLADVPALVAAARENGRQLIDIRTPPPGIPVATGRKRSGKRLLTVGTDCALGKKYTALSLWRAFQARGIDTDFRATGQTGIMIAGSGIPMDAVVADFEAGAAEILSPDADPAHWDVIEGQGSLFHPAYSPVSLGLLHGSQPDVFVVCHSPGRTHIVGLETFPLPDIEAVIELTLMLGKRTNPAIRCGGIALNTSDMTEEAALAHIAAETERLGLPAADPIRGGAAFDALVESCLGAA